MKENNEKKPKRKISKEKRFYLITALGATTMLLAVIVVAIAVSSSPSSPQAGVPQNSSTVQNHPPVADGNEENEGNQDVVVTPEGMLSPVETVSVLHDYGFYHNVTLNNYYEHKGMDFSAVAGTEVLAVEGGVVESIYKDDLLLGTEIVIAHDDGLKTVYRFVEEAEGLKVGDKVKKGQVIACVAEANGEEYKDGAHLHFEVHKNGVSVDPANYLTFEEK